MCGYVVRNEWFREHNLISGIQTYTCSENTKTIYGSMFHCFNMVKMWDVNNFEIIDTGIASFKQLSSSCSKNNKWKNKINV